MFIRQKEYLRRWLSHTPKLQQSHYFYLRVVIRQQSTQNREDNNDNIVIAGFTDDNKDLVADGRLRVSAVLSNRPVKTFTISHKSTIDEAISHLVQKQIGSSLVLNDENEIVGIFSSRDILRFIHNCHENGRLGKVGALTASVTVAMTKKDKMIYCSPTDTLRRCRDIMLQTKIRSLPVVDKGEVLGIMFMKEVADASFHGGGKGGGKKGYMANVVGRKGLPAGTRVRQSAAALAAAASKKNEILNENISEESADISSDALPAAAPSADSCPYSSTSRFDRLTVEMAAYSLPHPFKTHAGVGATQRDYGALEFATDPSLNEDAHFAIDVPTDTPGVRQVYTCVADGVGSWRQYGLDPRLYAQRLVRNAKEFIENDANNRAAEAALLGGALKQGADPLQPLDVITEAWHMTASERVYGSSTMCVATLDSSNRQLLYSNLGDCGIMLLRHIDSPVAGYMRERQLPRFQRKNDLRIAYLSQQQLRSFNLPYQLGYSDENCVYEGVQFESPTDADTASIPVLAGDIVIQATDGLFDNIDLDEIVDIVGEWEEKWFPRDTSAVDSPSEHGQDAVNELAKTLVDQARTYSVDKNRDSPFALLAKENDIMWGGGMPDDTTVIVLRVVAGAHY